MAHPTDDMSDEHQHEHEYDDDTSSSRAGEHAALSHSHSHSHSPPSSSLSAYKHLRVRYTALRRAYRRQEGDMEAVRAAHEQTRAEAQRAAEEKKKEQRAVQQLLGQIAQLQDDNEALRAREQQQREREQQLVADVRSVESQLVGCRAESARLQSELDRQCAAVAAERKRLVATVSRHLHEESAQQLAIQSISQTVNQLTDELAAREAEREQMTGEVQLLRDALQVAQTHFQQHAHRQHEAGDTGMAGADGTLTAPPTARPADQAGLFLSPLHVASPCVSATPSTSTCAALSSSASPRAVAASTSRAYVLSSPLAAQLLHADTMSSPRPDSAIGCDEESKPDSHNNTRTAVSHTRPSSSHASSPSAARLSVSPLSPFSADEFPPLPSSPSAVRHIPHSVWNKPTERTAGKQHNRLSMKRDEHAMLLSTTSDCTPRSVSVPPSVGRSNIARSLHFTGIDDDSRATAHAPPTAAANRSHTCSPPCSSCRQATPPASVLIPLTFATPGGAKTAGDGHREESLASPSAAVASAARQIAPSATPRSTCQLRASSVLLTPISSSQRSFAVLDSEFRRVKRWTAQLQQQITQQQQQQRGLQQRTASKQDRPDICADERSRCRVPASATVPSLLSHRSTEPRKRSNSEPHHSVPREVTFDSTLQTSPAFAAADTTNDSSLSTPQPHQTNASFSASAATSSPASLPSSVSVSSLLVQLSLCESELAARGTSLRAATQHIAALHDKLSVMADSVEGLEASMEENSQQWKQHSAHAAEERDRERSALQADVQAARDRVAQLTSQCDSVQTQLDATVSQAASQHAQYVQQSVEWEQRRHELISRVAGLESRAQQEREQQRRLQAELDLSNAALRQREQSGSADKQQCSEDDRKDRKDAAQIVSLVASTSEDAASPPLLQLVEQQLSDELTELQRLVRCM